MSAPFNKLAARKELGSILHRLDEQGLHTTILRRIVRRHIENLNETLPVEEFGPTLILLRDALTLDHWGQVRKIAKEIQELIPTTIGMIPAGTVVELPDGRVVIKRKSYLELCSCCDILEPIPHDTIVKIL